MIHDFDREMAIEESQEASELAAAGRVCPMCGCNGLENKGIETSWHNVIECGVEWRAPFRKCLDCGFEYTDYEYEELQGKALMAAGKLRSVGGAL